MPRIITDISHWQGLVDFQKMKDAGASAVIFKASQYYEDKNYETNAAAVKGILPFAAYHYYDNSIDPNTQAQKFANALEGTDPKFIIADYEDRIPGDHGGWKKLYTFLVKLQDLVPNKKIVIYSTYYYWKENSPQAFWQKSSLDWFGQFKFWYAAYNTRSWEDQLIPKPWMPEDTLMWQYSAKGNFLGEKYGVSSIDIDVNRWTGTEEEFIEYFGEEVQEPPTPPTEPPTGVDLMAIEDAIDRLTNAVIGTGKDTVDAIEGLDISVPSTDPPTEPPTPLDWSNIQVRANPDNYPRRWELDSTANNDVNIPFFRNNDVTDSKIILWDGVIVKENLPPSRYWSTISQLMNILDEFAWVRAFNVKKPANGKWFHMPTEFITTAEKVCDNWYGGAFVRRKDLKAA